MINVELIKPEDCQYIVDWNKDKDEDFLFQWAGLKAYSYPITLEQVGKRINMEGISIYKIIEGDEIIGTVELNSLNTEELSIKVSRFLIKKDKRGKGYGKQILEIVADKVFHEMNFKKLTLNVYKFNIGAIKCYEKAGFIVDTLNQNLRSPKWDSYVMILENK